MIPWFVFGFIAATTVNSLLAIPEPLLYLLKLFSQFCLALAMAALGLQTRWITIKQAGPQPLLLALILFLMLMFGGYFLNLLLITA